MRQLFLAALLLIAAAVPAPAQFMPLGLHQTVAGGGTPAVDGTNTAGGSGVSTVALTTTQSNDVIIVTVGGANTGTAGAGVTVSGCSLSWTQKSFSNDGTSGREVQLWYAIAATPLSACTITATANGSWTLTGITAMGISGANTSTPFDPNGASSGTATGVTSNPTVSGISTSNANDILIGGVVAGGSGPPTAGAGFTQLWNSSAVTPVLASEYEVVSATQSGISLTFGGLNGAGVVWAMLAAAVQ